MKTTALDFVPNATRKIRAGRPEAGGIPKGNANSTFAGQINLKDQTRHFPFVVFGVEHPYKPEPVDNVGGVWFDQETRSSYRGVRLAPGEPKAPKAAKTSKRRRKDPGAGRRPSLSSIRSKG